MPNSKNNNSTPPKQGNQSLISWLRQKKANLKSQNYYRLPTGRLITYNELMEVLSKNVTIQFQMKAVPLVTINSPHFQDKTKQITQFTPSPRSICKPIPQQTLNFLKNLKDNRLVIPKEISLQEKLKIYFRQYKQLYEQNKRLNRQFIEVIEKKNELAELLITKKKLSESAGGQVKRKRRYAFQIRREFSCPMSDCGKCYGTEGSLTQHVKIKHQEYFKSGEYDIYINELIKGKGGFETESI